MTPSNKSCQWTPGLLVVIARALVDWFVELPLEGGPPAPGSSHPAPDRPGGLRPGHNAIED
jgi:hypothetical protein